MKLQQILSWNIANKNIMKNHNLTNTLTKILNYPFKRRQTHNGNNQDGSTLMPGWSSDHPNLEKKIFIIYKL